MDDKAQKQIDKKVKEFIKKELQNINDYLVRVIKGEESEDHVTKDGICISRNVPHATRVAAARAWKELTIDKVVPDMKELKKIRESDTEKLSKSIREIARQKRLEAEKKLKGEGKLTTLERGSDANSV